MYDNAMSLRQGRVVSAHGQSQHVTWARQPRSVTTRLPSTTVPGGPRTERRRPAQSTGPAQSARGQPRVRSVPTRRALEEDGGDL